MVIEIWLAVGLVFVLTLSIVYITSRGPRRLEWEAMDPGLEKFNKEKDVPVTDEDSAFLEKYSSLGVLEFGPPDSEGRLVARLAR